MVARVIQNLEVKANNHFADVGNRMTEEIKSVEGKSVDGEDDHWKVECPDCGEGVEYVGFFDPDDITDCSKCDCKFKTTKVWFNVDTYMI